MLNRVIVVSLEGFGEPEPGGEEFRTLHAAGIPVVRCGPGQLPQALQTLETAEGASSSAAGVSGARERKVGEPPPVSLAEEGRGGVEDGSSRLTGEGAGPSTSLPGAASRGPRW